MIFWIDAKVFPRAQELLSQAEAIVELTDLDSK
jgi:hypothetical protein